ncbi:MAG: sigma 54-interacting transcriptional regulator [Candidatus Hydrogenedentes bacterium]|nr:sigma 54-interacting transcriptional regulator [Candidatus Hydrogenedentota bacterium]
MSRILVVEDEAVLQLTFSEFLKQQGYDVVCAADYQQALTYLDAYDFDLIITDIILAGKTGVDLLRTIRERDLACPVVMITGEPNVETASEAVRLGAFDYLAKPVTRDALQRVARLALDQKRIADERDHYAKQMDIYRSDLQAIFNSVNEGIITVDADMCVRQVNTAAARILGLATCALSRKPFSSIRKDFERAQDALEETLRTREPVVDRRIQLQNGDDEKVLVINTMPLISERGSFVGAVLMIRDMTRLTRLERQLEDSQQYRNIIGKSGKMQEIFQLIRELAGTDSTVLICGESGTGKELVAAALHHASARGKGPFLRVNCAALSDDILESELFGHVKGAFTGAVRDRIGRFEAANGGTILLDEIGDISPRLQLRLLRVLQEREFERVGSSSPIRTDVRVIASSNQDLEQKIRAGEFRQDLYYRLNVVRIHLPPLRERRQDIPLLVDHFCRRFNSTIRREVTGVSADAMELIMNYPWPGNVRELENCIERAFIVCHDTFILPRHLPPEILAQRPSSMTPALANQMGGTDGDGQNERQQIEQVLHQTDWNVAKAARRLGIARNTLYQRLRTLNIARPSD